MTDLYLVFICMGMIPIYGYILLRKNQKITQQLTKECKEENMSIIQTNIELQEKIHNIIIEGLNKRKKLERRKKLYDKLIVGRRHKRSI